MEYDKLSGGMICLLNDYAARGDLALAVRSRLFGAGEPVTWEAEPAAVVFLQCDETHPLDDMHESIRIQSSSGAIRTARIPLSRIDEVSCHPAVRRIQIARYLLPKLDKAMPRIGVPQFRSHNGCDGSGVVIGIVDSGIDGTHPAFGDGRILRVWDQTQPGAFVPEGPGVELRDGHITSFSTDELGHGTHVAGIAAGALPPYIGVAPAAKFVIVKTTFLDADVAAGVRYLFRVVEEMGLPAVINLSLGGHLDAHDGSDELSQVINEHSGPGRIICCAAGNEALDKIHAQVVVGQGQVTTIQFEVLAGTPILVLNGWYPAIDEIEVAILDPAGGQTSFQGPLLAELQVRQYMVDSGIAFVTMPGPNPVNGDHHIHIQLGGLGGGPLRPGQWKLVLRGRTVHGGRVDFWSADMAGGPGVPFRSHVQDSMKIGAPGCASQAITVGCFASRRYYLSADGFTRTGPFDEDVLAPDTSPGPLRNAARKPDLVAPGAVVVSAFAAHSHLKSDGEKVTELFKVNYGSSMSTAVVSGLVALMLQGNPGMTPAAAKQRLVAASSMRGLPSGTFDFQSGFGLIDAGRL